MIICLNTSVFVSLHVSLSRHACFVFCRSSLTHITHTPLFCRFNSSLSLSRSIGGLVLPVRQHNDQENSLLLFLLLSVPLEAWFYFKVGITKVSVVLNNVYGHFYDEGAPWTNCSILGFNFEEKLIMQYLHFWGDAFRST